MKKKCAGPGLSEGAQIKYNAGKDPAEEKLQYICLQFRIPGEIVSWKRLSGGHINEAYYAEVSDGTEAKEYLIQRVNTYVFHNPAAVMKNIELITRHLMDKVTAPERRRRLHYHHTADGKNYLVLQGTAAAACEGTAAGSKGTSPASTEVSEYWRLCNYIESSVSFEEAAGDAEVLRKAGQAFGRFERQMEDFDAAQLTETIPHFHDTAWRLQTLFDIVERDPLGRVKDALSELALIREHAEFGRTLCRQIERGELPLRVTHNDTKTNNVLFDRETHEPLVVIDLDTCMPGLVCHDFGDTIRFAACTAGEDEADGMHLDLGLFRAYTEGYLSEMGGVLTKAELDSLPAGAAVITLELASRFLADYLTGDKYFRVDEKRPGHNLRRARAQLTLFQDMMKHMEDMSRIVQETARKVKAGHKDTSF